MDNSQGIARRINSINANLKKAAVLKDILLNAREEFTLSSDKDIFIFCEQINFARLEGVLTIEEVQKALILLMEFTETKVLDSDLRDRAWEVHVGLTQTANDMKYFFESGEHETYLEFSFSSASLN